MRGADGNPHQVRLDDARAVELAGARAGPDGDAAGHARGRTRTEICSCRSSSPSPSSRRGWYAIECEVAIDGAPETVRPGARFAVPWPRGATRRDDIRIGRSIAVDDGKVRIDQLLCRSDFVSSATRGRKRRSR